MEMADRALMEASAGGRLAILLASYRRLTGADLAADEAGLWHARFAVLAHDTGQIRGQIRGQPPAQPQAQPPATPPLFFYANATALRLFRIRAPDFIGMPSARSAQADQDGDHRAERAAMLARLEQADIVTGYSGIRVAADGTRFRIRDAVIWNLVDKAGGRHGQAALIRQWEDLAPTPAPPPTPPQAGLDAGQ